MIQTYQRLQRRRAAGEIDGFTLIELLIVIVVLGILAAIVVFALGGVTGKSAAAACQSDAKTVGVGVSALLAENPQYQSGGINTTQFQALMTLPAGGTIPSGDPTVVGFPFVQTWPSSSSYAVFVGDGTSTLPALTSGSLALYTQTGTAVPTAAATGTKTTYGDVYVYGLSGTYANDAMDATLSPIEACNFAVTGKP